VTRSGFPLSWKVGDVCFINTVLIWLLSEKRTLKQIMFILLLTALDFSLFMSLKDCFFRNEEMSEYNGLSDGHNLVDKQLSSMAARKAANWLNRQIF